MALFHLRRQCSNSRQLPEVKRTCPNYRVQVHKLGSRVIIYSRNGHDFTEWFPPIAQLLHELPAKAVLDGEVVTSSADGMFRNNSVMT